MKTKKITHSLLLSSVLLTIVSCSSEPESEPGLDPNPSTGQNQEVEFAPSSVAGKSFRFYKFEGSGYDLNFSVIADSDPQKAKIYVEPMEYVVIGSPSFHYEKTGKNNADVSCVFYYDILGVAGFDQIFDYQLNLTFLSPNYGIYEGELTHYEGSDDLISVNGVFTYDSDKDIEELANEAENSEENETPGDDETPETPGDDENQTPSIMTDFEIFDSLQKTEMIFVEGGSFWMGAQSNSSLAQNYDPNADRYDYYSSLKEGPVHLVYLNGFCIGKYEVTQQLWSYVMCYAGTVADGSIMNSYASNPWLGEKPSLEYGLGDYCPAYYVSYYDIVNIFIPRLNRITGLKFRLPTEAEWEYAARGGNKSMGYIYSGSNTLHEVAWNTPDYTDKEAMKAHMVGLKNPNELGLYDMSGNVSEWCSDWAGEYTSVTQTNPTGPTNGTYRVDRGGEYQCPWNGLTCRVSCRSSINPDVRSRYSGFRLVCTPE